MLDSSLLGVQCVSWECWHREMRGPRGFTLGRGDSAEADRASERANNSKHTRKRTITLHASHSNTEDGSDTSMQKALCTATAAAALAAHCSAAGPLSAICMSPDHSPFADAYASMTTCTRFLRQRGKEMVRHKTAATEAAEGEHPGARADGRPAASNRPLCTPLNSSSHCAFVLSALRFVLFFCLVIGIFAVVDLTECGQCRSDSSGGDRLGADARCLRAQRLSSL